MYNTDTLYKAQNKVNKFFNDYSSLAFDARHHAIYEKGPKILTSKQMLQKLQIPFVQVKASNTSENLFKSLSNNTFFLSSKINYH